MDEPLTNRGDRLNPDSTDARNTHHVRVEAHGTYVTRMVGRDVSRNNE